MNKIKCPNGHYYDADEFSECPHCNRGQEPKTEAISSPTRGTPVEKTWDVADVPEDQEEKTLVLSVLGVSNSSSEKTEAIFSNKLAPDAQRSQGAVTREKSDAEKAREGSLADDEDDGLDDTEKTQFVFGTSSSAANEEKKEAPAAAPEPEPDTAKETPSERMFDPIVGWLVCIHGKRFGECFTIGIGKNSIGRNVENRISIAGDAQVSRLQHAYVIYEPRSRKYYLQPGNSSGLTYLNQQLVLLPEPLKDRDEIGLNDSRFLFIPLCNDSFSWDTCE